jgi:hypothetical protein
LEKNFSFDKNLEVYVTLFGEKKESYHNCHVFHLLDKNFSFQQLKQLRETISKYINNNVSNCCEILLYRNGEGITEHCDGLQLTPFSSITSLVLGRTSNIIIKIRNKEYSFKTKVS